MDKDGTMLAPPKPAPQTPGSGAGAGPGRWLRQPIGYAWAVPALLMAAIGGAGVHRPGLWADELATWAAVAGPWSRTAVGLGYADMVIAPYYLLMNGWVELFGTSDVALRAPSVIAMALAASFVGGIGARLGGARAGLLAGVLFAVLPSTSRHAQEARVYALVVLAAAVATYLLVRIPERPTRWRFAGYAGAVALTGLFHAVALLVLAVHGGYLLIRHRELVPRWLVAATAGLVPVLPLLVLGAGQTQQIEWIGDFGLRPLGILTEAFGGAALAAGFGLAAAWSRPLRHPGALYVAWALAPLALLLAVSQVLPLMVFRYLLFTMPAWALLAGAALARPRAVWAALAVSALAALSVPAQLDLRSPGGHDETATRQMATVIGQDYRPGDGIAYAVADADTRCCSWVARDAIEHYLPADRRPRDVFLQRPPRTGGYFLAGECDALESCLGSTPRLWIVRLGDHADPLRGLGAGKEALVRDRYAAPRVWRPSGFTVALVVAR
ncbi:glycosyltransferase family 39 protein [Micromonosporaceae bacterium B7E4]